MCSVERVVKVVVMLVFALFASTRLRGQSEFTEARGWFHINGYSHHFAAEDCNDQLLGFGFTHYRRRYGPMIQPGTSMPSRTLPCELSAYAGHSWTVPTKHLSFGVTDALMCHRSFTAHNELRPFARRAPISRNARLALENATLLSAVGAQFDRSSSRTSTRHPAVSLIAATMKPRVGPHVFRKNSDLFFP